MQYVLHTYRAVVKVDEISEGFINWVKSSNTSPIIELECNGKGVLSNSFNHEVSNFSLYPNPASEIIYLILPKTIDSWTIRLYNSNGQLVQEEVNQISIRSDHLLSGIYFVELEYGSLKSMKKVVISK